MKRNIYLFWVGDLNRICGLIEKLEKMDFNVIVGPTEADNIFLKSKYEYYRKAYNEGIWAFCSDVWRLWKMKDNIGLYMDTSVEVGDELPHFYDKYIKFKVAAFKESQYDVNNGILFSGEENNSFYQKALSMYDKKIDFSVNFYSNGPAALTVFFNTEVFLISGYKSQEKDGIYVGSLMEIRNVKEIYKVGGGSWFTQGNLSDRVAKANEWWKKAETRWLLEVKKSDHNIRTNNILIENGMISLLPQNIRNKYDNAKSKLERKEAVLAYRAIDYKLKISERLIWSRLYVFFTLKWLVGTL